MINSHLDLQSQDPCSFQKKRTIHVKIFSKPVYVCAKLVPISQKPMYDFAKPFSTSEKPEHGDAKPAYASENSRNRFPKQVPTFEKPMDNNIKPACPFSKRMQPSIRPKKVQQKERCCLICLEIVGEQKLWMELESCLDVFHSECLERYLQDKINLRSFPIRCPKCRREMNVEDIKNALQTQPKYQLLFEKYSTQAIIDNNPNEYDRCSTPNCDYAYWRNPSQPRYECPKCRKTYCKDCGANWRNGHACGKLKEIIDNYAYEDEKQTDYHNDGYYSIPFNNKIQTTKKPRLGFTDQEFKNYSDQQKFKECPRCHRTIEKIDRCNHITCFCGMEFCYLTGKPYHECSCGTH